MLATRISAERLAPVGSMPSACLSTSATPTSLRVAEPLLDRLLPEVALEARGLLDGGQSLELGRFQPPRGAGLEAHDGFGPELITVALDAVAVDHADASDRPNPARARRVRQITGRSAD